MRAGCNETKLFLTQPGNNASVPSLLLFWGLYGKKKKKKKSMGNTFRLFLSKAHLKERDLCPPCSLNSALSHLGGIQPSAPCKAENFAAQKKKTQKLHSILTRTVLFCSQVA